MNLVYLKSTDPYYNLAVEEYLFARSREEYLLFYVNAPSVVLGYNQCVQNEVDQEFCKYEQINVVRRSSGGGAVYHDEGNLNFSFISNAETDLLSDVFLHPVVKWFDALGVKLRIGKRKDLWLESGKKVCGTATKVSKGRVVNHGTLLIAANLNHLHLSLSPGVTNNLVKATKSVRSETANILHEFNGSITGFDEFRELLFGQVLKYYGLTAFTEPEVDEVIVAEIQQKIMDNNYLFRK